MLKEKLIELLSIASPTYQEGPICAHIKTWAETQGLKVQEADDSLLCSYEITQGLPHLVLVGHTDVVPTHFTPYVEAGRIHGSGASDMKGALAAYMALVEKHGVALKKHYNLSLIFYSREEMTPLHENGLYHLLKAFPEFFETVDLAIVGEPTDNTLQLGCVGSIHIRVKIEGVACHSARPWNGQNALYKALPFIQAISKIQPQEHQVFGQSFFDVLQLTESHTEKGRTTLPGWWEGNLNFRFAPVRTEKEALEEVYAHLASAGISKDQCTLVDSVAAGQVIETPTFVKVCQALDLPLQAKQAWTDVAQLTAQGISAFNFGPGLTSQAHKENEFLLLEDLELYYQRLESLLL